MKILNVKSLFDSRHLFLLPSPLHLPLPHGRMYGVGTRTYNEGPAHGIVMSFWIGMRLGDSLCILEAI